MVGEFKREGVIVWGPVPIVVVIEIVVWIVEVEVAVVVDVKRDEIVELTFSDKLEDEKLSPGGDNIIEVVESR